MLARVIYRAPASLKRRLRERNEKRRNAARASVGELVSGTDVVRAWRYDGVERLPHVITELTPEQARLANLALVESAARTCGALAFVVPCEKASLGSVLGVGGAKWTAFVDALLKQDQLDVARVVVGDSRQSIPGTSTKLETQLKFSDRFRLYVPMTYENSTISLGSTLAVEVQRWSTSAGEVLTGPVANPVSRVVKADDEVVPARSQNSESKTLKTFSPLLTDEADFEVDVVYTWVDDSDEDWNQKRVEAMSDGSSELVHEGANFSRFKNRDELKYSLRSINLYAPWVRKIWLVTDDQVPSWLDQEFPNLTVVSHRELWGDEPGLPTFNSHAIESQLRNIDGLSEHFVYFNDDVFLTKFVQRESFFTPAGQPKAAFTGPYLTEWEPQEWESSTTVAGKNIRQALLPEFNKAVIHRLSHNPHPLTKSLLAEVEQRFPSVFDHLAQSQFRDRHDLAPVAFALHFGFLQGQVVESDLSVEVRQTAEPKFDTELERLLAYPDSSEALCINDVEVKPERRVRTEEQNDQLIASFLSQRFPLPAPWEK